MAAQQLNCHRPSPEKQRRRYHQLRQHTFGHPLHAFDADQLQGNAVIVRPVQAGETLTTLDEVERTLDPADMIIADAKGPVCIAGILGGLTSGVSQNTKNVYLEGSYFNAVRVRKTAKRHAINSDAAAATSA